MKYSGDDFWAAYDTNSTDGRLNIKYVQDVVSATMGPDVPQWVIDKFVYLCQRASDYGDINWNNFRQE